MIIHSTDLLKTREIKQPNCLTEKHSVIMKQRDKIKKSLFKFVIERLNVEKCLHLSNFQWRKENQRYYYLIAYYKKISFNVIIPRVCLENIKKISFVNFSLKNINYKTNTYNLVYKEKKEKKEVKVNEEQQLKEDDKILL